MTKIPEPGSTMKAFCNCAKKETTWTVQKSSQITCNGVPVYTYSWTCLNCGKTTHIGNWYNNGEPYPQ